MSPKDCHLLFNLCDPVVCPSDRCDFGGAYPVQDVVQSGIVGSLALCLPNFKEGIYIPVCLTGVKAGIDGFLSVMQAYSDCLNENLETGRTVGMCDKIHSVYLCEFFWKQSLPLFKVAVPELIKTLVGETRGGGTYGNIQAAMDTAQNSLSYFTQNYAVNAFKAFKARGQEEIGSEICNNFVSVAYPSGGNFLDSLTEADSPPQFSGSFEKNEYSSAMGHPTYHYKVSYHIYAGKDSGVYYKVYLKSQETSYYEDSGSVKIIDSGYVPHRFLVNFV
jgi:hypothetical protein